MKKFAAAISILTLAIVLVVGFAGSVRAETGSGGGSTDSSIDLSTLNPLSCTDVGCVWDQLYKLAVSLATIGTTAMVLWGGFQILTAGGDPEKVKSGGKTVLYSAIGLVVVWLSVGVVSIVKSIVGGP